MVGGSVPGLTNGGGRELALPTPRRFTRENLMNRPKHARRALLAVPLLALGLTGCGGGGGGETDPCKPDGDGWASVDDVDTAIACDFSVATRTVAIANRVSGTYETTTPDTTGMDERERRVAMQKAMHDSFDAMDAGTAEWQDDVNGNYCMKYMHGHVLSVPYELAGRTFTNYLCIVDDADITYLNGLKSAPVAEPGWG